MDLRESRQDDVSYENPAWRIWRLTTERKVHQCESGQFATLDGLTTFVGVSLAL